jgi:hypothetical protein
MADDKPKTKWEETKEAVRKMMAPQGKSTQQVPVKKFEDTGKSAGAAIRGNNAAKQQTLDEMKGYKRGGKVKATGPAKLHKGERVLTVKQAKKPAVKKALSRKAQ